MQIQMTHNSNAFRGSYLLLVLSLVCLAGCGSSTDVVAQEAASKGSESKEGAKDDRSEKKTAENSKAKTENGLELPFPFRARIPARPLTGGDGWLNTDKPLTIKELKGKFVLLDFWTYCCINCMHIIPELDKLEKAYPNNLVVIGVHSAKFDGEKKTDNIRDAILRYEIEHPVVNDSEMKIWDRYGISSWPTMLLIDPNGNAVWAASGEQTFEDLDAVLKRALPYYRAKKLLNETPMKFALEKDKLPPSPLRFPSKLLADAKGKRLFISDSNHHRIIIASLDGKLLDVIGSGKSGQGNGSFEKAEFKRPQGMALVGNLLYIADTENHLIRKANLKTKTVSTIAGVGSQARERRWDNKPTKPSTTPISSPWALWPHKNSLYIAMAGPHQIWRMKLDENSIGPFAGNGAEDVVDGPLLGSSPFMRGYSSFAQPSGLASDGKHLFVADTEGSSVRAVPFDTNGNVKTLVGSSKLPGGRLFAFGDRDGTGLLKASMSRLGFDAKTEEWTKGPLLQHAIGIAYANGTIYVADTYNNKIKSVNPKTGECKTIAGSGKVGKSDGLAMSATFDEPEGLAVANGKLYIADTNNHAIRILSLSGEKLVKTLKLEGLKSPGK